MNELKIDLGKIEQVAEYTISLKKRLDNYSLKIEEADKGLEINNAVFIDILREKIKKLNDEVLNEAAKMDSLLEALNCIITRYTETEKHIAEYAVGSVTSGNTEEGNPDNTKIENIIEKFVAWLKEFLGWKKKENLSEERQREKEYDLYMQNRIFNLLKTKEYNKETWAKASVEKRKQILQKLLQRLMEIFGVNISSEIIFESLGSGTRGMYSEKKKSVYINIDYLSRPDSYQIMQTMIHEMRHAYQHAAIENPDSYNVSKETIKQWSENFNINNYKSTNNGYTFEEYVSQPIEYDAKNFAKQYSDVNNISPEYSGSW